MATAKKVAEEVNTKPIRYSKEQILASERYSNQRDILNVVLDDGMQYTIDDVEKRILNFLKGKVK